MLKGIIIGHLGQDPEMRYTPNGSAVTSFSVASSEKYGDKETTTWVRVSCWNRLAEVANQYLTKGSHVYVEGNLRTTEFEGRDGDKRFSVEMSAANLQFLGGGNGNGRQEEYQPTEDIDDLPF